MSGTALLLCHAAPLEAAGLTGRALPDDVELLEIGVGKTAAASSLTLRLGAGTTPSAVVLFGVCGAYPRGHGPSGGSRDVGDLCLVGDDRLADDGVEHEGGWTDLAELGLGPVGPWAADPRRTATAAAVLAAPIVAGATVSACSGTDALSRARAARSGAAVETMEGAAVAFVCARFGRPLVHLRAVGNRTGDRRRGGFDLAAAADRACAALCTLLDGGWR